MLRVCNFSVLKRKKEGDGEELINSKKTEKKKKNVHLRVTFELEVYGHQNSLRSNVWCYNWVQNFPLFVFFP